MEAGTIGVHKIMSQTGRMIQTVLGVVCIVAGLIGLAYEVLTSYGISALVSLLEPFAIASLIFVGLLATFPKPVRGLLNTLLRVVSGLSLEREERVSDVDARRRNPKEDLAVKSARRRASKLAKRHQGASTDKLASLLDAATEHKRRRDLNELDNFKSYFNSIRVVLEQKAADADEKASILLDKGTSYFRWGITFFIFSIVAWQVIAYITEFKSQYIYGIVSCSGLFIFIEFLSAWFLRQYRLFVDTSTYLIKVKAVFDRYMLVCLVADELRSKGGDAKSATLRLVDLLRAKIEWPESYLTKEPDIGFAREAVETMSLLLKSVRSQVTRAKKNRKRADTGERASGDSGS